LLLGRRPRILVDCDVLHDLTLGVVLVLSSLDEEYVLRSVYHLEIRSLRQLEGKRVRNQLRLGVKEEKRLESLGLIFCQIDH